MSYFSLCFTLTCLAILSAQIWCDESICDSLVQSGKMGLNKVDNSKCGKDNVCCNINLIQNMKDIFDKAKDDGYQKILVKDFNQLKTELQASLQMKWMYYDTQGRDNFNSLQNSVCDLIMEQTSEYDKCSCNNPVVRRVVEENVAIITRNYTKFTKGLTELQELLSRLYILGNERIENELIVRQLKAIVCKQCSGLRETMCMSECNQLLSLGRAFEIKKLELLERAAVFIQVKVQRASSQLTEINSENSISEQTMKDIMTAIIHEVSRLDPANCGDAFESQPTDIQLGAGCSVLPPKCNSGNKASCTLANCKDACRVNCCNGKASTKCTIPTCKSCKNPTETENCNSNTASQCAGISEQRNEQDMNSGIDSIDIEVYNSSVIPQDIQLGAGCSVLPPKCNSGNKASCTLANCKDACRVNCCNGKASTKCTIPTCKSCKNPTETENCNSNTASQCAGIEEQMNELNVENIMNIIYKIRNQIETSKKNIGMDGRYICQQLMDTFENIHLITECEDEKMGDYFYGYMNEVFNDEQMEQYFGDKELDKLLNNIF
ncbi:hypothetical protein LOD99_5828 [Oopsacas minuta]|uniref:Uncharacterized protein n=1 Tax=Oopsacas minuta TaxID=111878 RepID=A0AAV7JNJ8_9METZ|nr:hypothetical protein LOD99_5828 [Oopsacas minuta]